MREIPAESVRERLREENPWWGGRTAGELPFSGLRPRPYLRLLWPYLSRRIRRSVVLMGPRRVGKTVLLHHAVGRLLRSDVSPSSIFFISVDHPLYNGLSLEELLKHCSRETGVDYKQDPCYVFFDEIQYLKDWEHHLKAIADSYAGVKCVVSGSAAAALKLKSTESGAGRFTDFLLPPLTFFEYAALMEKAPLFGDLAGEESGVPEPAKEPPRMEEINALFLNYLNFGGYPEVALSPEMQREPGRFIKSDIIDKVLLRDLPTLYGIQDVQELNYLFTTLAFNSGGEVSLDGLTKGAGIAKNTVKRYIEYLEAAFLVKVVHRVDINAGRFRRAPSFKVYLTNPSIRAALFSPLRDSGDALGPMVETAVFAQWFHSLSETGLHYARWKNGEVDMVSLGEDLSVRWALEVKWSDRFADHPGELTSLRRFCHYHNLKEAGVTTRSVAASVEYENIRFRFVPSALYCYQRGREQLADRR